MTRGMRRGAAISFAVHLMLGLLLVLGIRVAQPPDVPEETAVSMVFQGTAQSSRAPEATLQGQASPAR